MKKRMFVLALAAVLTMGLVGCGEKKPSLEEVEKAIAEGNITIEDALEKGFVTKEWADAYIEKNSVEMADKRLINAMDDFVTTAKDGSEYTKKDMGKTVMLAFMDPSSEEAKESYRQLVSAYEDVKKAGGDILVAVRGKTDDALFADAPFQVIEYNDSLKAALKQNAEMAEADPFMGVWVVNGSAISAWYPKADAKDLAESAVSFVKLQEEMEADSSDNGGTMAVMGK